MDQTRGHGVRRPIVHWAPIAALVLSALLAGQVSLANAAPLDDLKRLVEQRQFKQAFELARANSQLLGKGEFDYWFGLAAIDGGNATEGVFALERYLAANPDSASARLELGRGYFVMGDMTRAKDMFDEVSQMNPPAEVLAQIANYQQAIGAKQSAAKGLVGGFLETGFVYDSNVNGGVSDPTIELPFLGTVTLTEDGRARKDRGWLAAGGVYGNLPLNASWNLFAGVNADERRHRETERFDQRNVSFALGAGFKRNDQLWRLSINASQLNVGGARYRDLVAGNIEWIQSPTEKRGLTVFAQAANIGYEGGNSVRDARLGAIGVGWRQPLSGNGQPSLSVNFQAGREQNRRDRDDLGRDFASARASLHLWPLARTMAGSSLTLQSNRYLELDAFFGTTRRDRFTSLEAYIQHYFTSALSLRLDLSRTVNNSNIELFAFTRPQAALKLRYDFK